MVLFADRSISSRPPLASAPFNIYLSPVPHPPLRCLFRMPSDSSSSSRIDLGDVTPHNIKLLKVVNAVVFPVVYHDKFYKDVLEAGDLAKLAFYNDIVVGAVCCRVDVTQETGERKLYIMTLGRFTTGRSSQVLQGDIFIRHTYLSLYAGCLAPYRRLGIGTQMLNHVMDIVEKDGNFDAVFLHVQINNDSAINFYKRFGFDIVETKEQYYKKIEPADAHVLEKRLKPTKSVNGSAAVAAAASTGSNSQTEE